MRTARAMKRGGDGKVRGSAVGDGKVRGKVKRNRKSGGDGTVKVRGRANQSACANKKHGSTHGST